MLDHPDPRSGELRRLRNEVLMAVAVKLLAIAALALAFFGHEHRPHLMPQDIFPPSVDSGPTNK
jgi:hypothetical protein